MAPKLKNPYGLQSGKVVTADIVARGLACGCICPDCKERLIANHGTGIKQPYFSHESGAECEAAYETALHLLAKEVLAEERRILLPPLEVTVDQQISSDAKRKAQILKSRMVPVPSEVSDLVIPTTTIVSANHYQRFDRVDVEVYLDTVIPDVVMRVADRTLLVEIFVTHGVTDAKRRWLEENDLPMVEFDFSAADRTIGKADLKKAFLQPRRPYGDGRSEWIHHPRLRATQESLNNDFRAKYIDQLNPLIESSNPATQATCHHDPTEILGDDGVRRSLCRKCWKFFGRVAG